MVFQGFSPPLWLPQEAPTHSSPGVGRRQRYLAFSIITALVLGAAVITPFAAHPLTPVPGLLAMYSASMILTNLLLAALLLIKGRVEARRDTIRLGCAYLYVGLILIPQTASFPGALMPEPLIGTPETSPWFWVFWHLGFALVVVRYAFGYGRGAAAPARLWPTVAGVAAATLCLTIIATTFGAQLPPLLRGGHFTLAGAGLAMHAAVILTTLAALASVARLRASTPEQLWKRSLRSSGRRRLPAPGQRGHRAAAATPGRHRGAVRRRGSRAAPPGDRPGWCRRDRRADSRCRRRIGDRV